MATVLVVDDEPDLRDLVALHLERDGHLVLTAADGAAALRTLERVLPDLVVLDLAMPGVDGWEVLGAMKAEPGAEVSRVPVVVLTAHDSPDNRIRTGIEGALRLLSKPFGLDELRDEIRRALAGGPEPAERRRAQAAALEELVRRERGADGEPVGVAVRPHLTRLERRRTDPERDARAGPPASASVGRLAGLTAKQRHLLEVLAGAASVSAAAAELGTSRSNVYATLRRVARRLDVGSVPELVVLARTGELGGRRPT